MEAFMARQTTIASDLFVANEPESGEAHLRTGVWEYYVFCISRTKTRGKVRWVTFVKCIFGMSKEIALENLKEFYESPYTIVVSEDQFDKYRDAIYQANRRSSARNEVETAIYRSSLCKAG